MPIVMNWVDTVILKLLITNICNIVCFLGWFLLFQLCQFIQAWIAKLVEHRLGTKEVLGSNPGKGESIFLTRI